jgi:hypothetical protein
MKPSLILLILVAVLVAAIGASSRIAAAPPSRAESHATNLLSLPRATAAGQITLFGYVKSLTRTDRRFELRFDPAVWLSGVTGHHATKDVSNDYSIFDETHRLLTYIVPASAHVTVLVAAVNTKAITPASLAQMVKRGNAHYRGFWIKIGGKNRDAVLSLDQQYQP